MIPRADILEWRSHVPWALDEQVEQDLVISRALVEIYSDPFLSSALGFRGGTALHKLHFKPPGRYSEDIDLVQLRPEAIGQTLDALRSHLDPWLGQPKRKMGNSMVTLKYRFESESLPPVPLRLKVEINGREHGAFGELASVPFAVRSRWFSGEANLTTFTLEELLATKLRALYQRSRGRDAFDLDHALRLKAPPEPQKIIAYFLAYMERGGQQVSRAEFERNLVAKAEDPDFLNDIVPLLSGGGEPYDPCLALDRIDHQLIALLPGAPWQRPTS